jgi:hypothetical protein
MAHLAHGQNYGPVGTQANRVIIFTTPPLPVDTSLISKKRHVSCSQLPRGVRDYHFYFIPQYFNSLQNLSLTIEN